MATQNTQPNPLSLPPHDIVIKTTEQLDLLCEIAKGAPEPLFFLALSDRVFHLFPSLPVELRLLIWKYALPVNMRGCYFLNLKPALAEYPAAHNRPPFPHHHIKTCLMGIEGHSRKQEFSDEMYETELLRTCSESRKVYLTTFPDEIESCKGLIRYNSTKTLVYIKDFCWARQDMTHSAYLIDAGQMLIQKSTFHLKHICINMMSLQKLSSVVWSQSDIFERDEFKHLESISVLWENPWRESEQPVHHHFHETNPIITWDLARKVFNAKIRFWTLQFLIKQRLTSLGFRFPKIVFIDRTGLILTGESGILTESFESITGGQSQHVSSSTKSNTTSERIKREILEYRSSREIDLSKF